MLMYSRDIIPESKFYTISYKQRNTTPDFAYSEFGTVRITSFIIIIIIIYIYTYFSQVSLKLITENSCDEESK